MWNFEIVLTRFKVYKEIASNFLKSLIIAASKHSEHCAMYKLLGLLPFPYMINTPFCFVSFLLQENLRRRSRLGNLSW